MAGISSGGVTFHIYVTANVMHAVASISAWSCKDRVEMCERTAVLMLSEGRGAESFWNCAVAAEDIPLTRSAICTATVTFPNGM